MNPKNGFKTPSTPEGEGTLQIQSLETRQLVALLIYLLLKDGSPFASFLGALLRYTCVQSTRSLLWKFLGAALLQKKTDYRRHTVAPVGISSGHLCQPRKTAETERRNTTEEIVDSRKVIFIPIYRACREDAKVHGRRLVLKQVAATKAYSSPFLEREKQKNYLQASENNDTKHKYEKSW